jgi:uncharacterized protein YfaS (alpha-2-macroglobulin family)/TolA-binding protein
MRRTRWLVVPLALAASLPWLSARAEDSPAAALRAAQEPLRDRAWGKAADALRAVRTRFPGAPEATEAWVLEARALLLAGRPREAVDAATEFLKAKGDDAWAGRMHATTADAYAALQAHGDQSRVLRARADFLTGPGYRAKIAALHVRLGDEDFDGVDAKDDLGRPVKRKDFARAIQSYGRALALGVSDADRLRVRSRGALALEEVRDFANAAAAWDRLLAEEGAAPGADPEAWLVGRGRARLRAGQAAEARKDLRDALATYPRGARRLEVLRLLAEERFAAAGGPEGEIAFEEGVQFLRRAMAEHREDPQAPAVQRALAEAYAGRGQWQRAAAEWRGLVERFPTDAAAPEWRNALAQALANAGRWDDAVAEWKAFLAAFPNHALWQHVQSMIPHAKFGKGRAYAAEGDVDGAIAAFRAFAEEFSTDPRAPEALVEVGVLLRGRKDHEGAIAVWRGVTGRYAGSPQAPRAWLLVSLTLEDDLGRLEEAIQSYEALIQKHGGTGESNEARARLDRLRAKHLEVRGERVIGSADEATLRVLTRNLPSLKVKVYKLGLEDYFRRKQTVQGVENVQVEIVKPDVTAEWKVEPYAPYALLQGDRRVPVSGPGAYVVVAGDDDLTSTTLLLVSDVETVVKSSPGRQVLVWARNRATGAPVEGATVLASDGSSVFAEGKTGKDGVWILDTDRSARRVLVLAGGHPASTELDPGATFSEGWQTKVFVHTDRPVYRPGQTVTWRAIFRRADGGAYRNTAGAKAWAVLKDARGSEVERKEVVASAAGTFDGAFALDGEAPLGDWSVRVDVDHRSFEGGFRVLEYRKPEFSVAVIPAKASYATGEDVKATIRLRYAFGGDVVGAPVQWEVTRVARDFAPSAVNDYSWYFQDPDALERARRAARSRPQGAIVARGETRTDGNGEAKVSFPTTERDEDAEYVVTASAVDVTRRFVVDEGRIPVVRRDHWAVVTTDKRVYRPKQELRATLQTVDANQTPVSRSGKAILARVKRSAAPPGGKPQREDAKAAPTLREEEIEVQSISVSTDAKGRAEVRFVLPGPGTFRVRYAATDARGARVTAFATLDVSGEAEDLSKDARLVVARETYTEGERAEVLLQSPVTRVQALLTFEGEKVLSYRLVDVDGPSTILDVPVEAAYAPNVVLKVAIPGPDRLLQAEDEIVVFRYLDVSLAPSRATAAPGETVSIEVTTKDAAGNPLSAEVGVAVVDEALYQVSPDRTPAIKPFFYDRKRVNRVATSSSVGFRTYGTTRETNKDVLANAAAQGGDAARVFAQSALRLAREASGRGDMDTAVAQALRAMEADPQSWDARAFLSDLRAQPQAQEALKKFDESNAAMGELRKALADAGRADRPAAKPGAPPAPTTPAPETDAEVADLLEAGEDRDRSKSKDDKSSRESEASEKESVGVGGGAGGAFKGRGGTRHLRTGGGGAKAGPGQAGGGPTAGTYSNGASAGDFRARTENLLLSTNVVDRSTAQTFEFRAFDLRVVGPESALRKRFADTAAWHPHVVTDAKGRASFEVTLPDNLTTWRATGRGIAGDSLVGEGSASFVVKKDVLLRVDAPRFLVQTDHATVPSAVHNGTDAEILATVTMKAEGVALAGEDGQVAVPANGRGIRDRALHAREPGGVRLEGAVSSTAGTDRVEVVLGTIPRGVRATEGRSGVISTKAGAEQETFFDVSEKAVPGASRLVVMLYPGIDAAILDALTALDLFPYGCVEQTVHRFLPATWARTALTDVGSPDAKRLADLDQAIRLSVARLKNLANADGTYGWFRGGEGDVSMTALALLGLRAAQRLGIAEAADAVNRTAAGLRKIVKSGPDDAQALGHWALASVGQVDEEAYQVTFRRRNEELSVPGLAWLAFAALEAQRTYDAEELVRLILSRRVDEEDATYWKGRPADCFTASARQATGLAVRALVLAGEASEVAERGMRWLLAHRVDGGFGTTTETAAFVGAASAWASKSRPAAYGGTVRVSVDGAEVRAVTVKAGGALEPKDRRFVVDASGWKPGRHALSFRLDGQGELGWAARLDVVEAPSGPEGDLAADEHGVKVERLYLDPEVVPVEGSTDLPPKPGYEVLRPSARPKVEAKSRDVAATGERFLVRLTVTAPRDLQYVMVEDPLPAGFEVLDETTAGPFEWQERRDDRQVFFLSKVKTGTVVLSYAIQAVHLGTFTALPTRAFAMYLPEVNGRAAGHRIQVVAERTKGTGPETPPTPDERYARAKDLLAKKAWKDAAAAFRALRDSEPLRDEVVEEVEAAILRCAIETKDSKEIVRAREELTRRNASRIPGDLWSARAIAAAYAEIGDVRVASVLDRDLLARAFGMETAWADTLKARGREMDGLTHVGESLKAYPVTNATASAALARAARFRELPRPEGRPGKAGAPMNEEALDALRSFAAHYAETTLAGPASYSVIDTLRRVRDLDGAVTEATAFLRRFPDSPFVDDSLYFLMDSRLQKFEAAPSPDLAAPVLEAAKRLSEERFRTDGGGLDHSEFWPRAWHATGRVRHVLGDLDGAIAAYRRAAPHVEDAREALAYLTEARLGLEETVPASVGGAARFPVKYRNVSEIRFKAYPVDLQVLFAVRKTLEGLNRIDLSGITPAHQWTLLLPDGGDHAWHEASVELPVGKDAPGVFLLVAKAGDLEASSVVIKTDLTVVLQQVGDKVRVHVTGADGKGVRGAYVTVSDGQTIKARGLSDGRGVFEAPGVGSKPFVVVSLDDRYAIAR